MFLTLTRWRRKRKRIDLERRGISEPIATTRWFALARRRGRCHISSWILRKEFVANGFQLPEASLPGAIEIGFMSARILVRVR
jgi:hypothetical protein